jgi:hypothetical protein
MISDLEDEERAQLGLKYIEDSIVELLTRHPAGMPASVIADTLGLRDDVKPGHRDMIAAGVLELLARTGRIIWDADARVYRDNPRMS